MSEDRSLRIIVVGGTAAGIAAAVRCRRLDERASIKIIEKESYVSHANSGVPYALEGVIEKDTTLVQQTPAGLKARFNLEVHINTELISISKEEHMVVVQSLDSKKSYNIRYDKLILAQGAEPAQLQIDGLENVQNFFTMRKQLDLKRIKDYVVRHECQTAIVIGGGFIGLRAVEYLRHLGLQVSLVESNDQVYCTFDKDIAHYLETELQFNNVHLYLGMRAERYMRNEAEDCSCIQLSDGSTVSSDLFVTAVGLNPRVTIALNAGLAVKRGVVVNTFMQTSDPDIYAVGNMVETENRLAHSPSILALGGPGSRQGRLVADHIYKRASVYSGDVDTTISRVFRLTAGITGMPIQKLRSIGYNPLWVTIHTPDHEGYYPASSHLTLRIIFEAYTGRLLGAQAVGKVGVDKRIDVLSTALQASMSVFDLEQLELSYAPQYGSSRDPVNLAGCTASNVVRRDLYVLHPDELVGHTSKWQIIDVRRAEDFSKDHVLDAENIPIDKLRQDIASIKKDSPVLVYSRVGYHGYIAYRILKQLGYEAANLDGGWKLWQSGGYQARMQK
jgi:NADPH-dependent 2,4-dienoyl-CoA reductase/sulfur reductase-like enzyme/rhodanese-related sulfurtransferase